LSQSQHDACCDWDNYGNEMPAWEGHKQSQAEQ
jgi:hypothetical protein